MRKWSWKKIFRSLYHSRNHCHLVKFWVAPPLNFLNWMPSCMCNYFLFSSISVSINFKRRTYVNLKCLHTGNNIRLMNLKFFTIFSVSSRLSCEFPHIPLCYISFFANFLPFPQVVFFYFVFI